MKPWRIAIVGGGPAGLMAADMLSATGHAVSVYDAMPTVSRKFLLAGKSGLNITHSEEYAQFAGRFGTATPHLRAALDGFTPADVRDWAAQLGTETFVGSSGRVFPTVMKASPLLRALVARLMSRGVGIFTRHRWTGFDGEALVFETPQGVLAARFDAVLLSLGGASWPRLGSDAAWVPLLKEKQVGIADLRPANCGFDLDWSDVFRDRFAGAAVKSVTATCAKAVSSGEFVVTRHGIEGSLVYAHAASLRDALETHGRAALTVDLAPGRSLERLAHDIARQDDRASFANRLRKGAGLEGVKAALLREVTPDANRMQPEAIARQIKQLALPVLRPRPIEEAISSAGGVMWSAIDRHYMLKALPGFFIAGEMIDWEAPTGGYLLTACFATGRAAACGMEAWLAQKSCCGETDRCPPEHVSAEEIQLEER